MYFTLHFTLDIVYSIGLDKCIMYPSLKDYTECLHCPKNPLRCMYSSVPLTCGSLFTVSIVYPNKSICNAGSFTSCFGSAPVSFVSGISVGEVGFFTCCAFFLRSSSFFFISAITPSWYFLIASCRIFCFSSSVKAGASAKMAEIFVLLIPSLLL